MGEEATEHTSSSLDTPAPFPYSSQDVHKAVSSERSGGEANVIESSIPLEVREKGHGEKDYSSNAFHVRSDWLVFVDRFLCGQPGERTA